MSLAGGSATRPSALAPEDTDDAVWIAQRMVLDAGAQAARLRRQASVRTATICEAAERETELIWQQASAQAAALREAAEREAAQLRATVMKLSAGPLVAIDRDVAGRGPATLAGEPPARLARRPQGPPRQLMAIRVAAAATSALFLFALAAGTTELALHGFAFFVFRSSGTGETGPTVGSDQQFLAQQAAAAKAASARAAAQRAHTPGHHSAKNTSRYGDAGR